MRLQAIQSEFAMIYFLNNANQFMQYRITLNIIHFFYLSGMFVNWEIAWAEAQALL